MPMPGQENPHVPAAHSQVNGNLVKPFKFALQHKVLGQSMSVLAQYTALQLLVQIHQWSYFYHRLLYHHISQLVG